MKQYKNKKAMALLMAAVLAGSTLYSGVADAASAIKLNKKTAKIAVGKSVTLKVRGTKKKVKWKSSKKTYHESISWYKVCYFNHYDHCADLGLCAGSFADHSDRPNKSICQSRTG